MKRYYNTNIDDIYLNNEDENIMIVELSVYDYSDDCERNFIKGYTVELDLKYMGIDWNGEFEYELAKDFQRALDKHLEEKDELPSEKELKELVEVNYYNMLDNNEDEEDIKIETNEIVKNNLLVKNLKQLSYSVYQDEDLIEDEKRANECIKYLTENLKSVYDLLDNVMDILNEDLGMEKLQDELNKIDLYQVGDIINFLETINIKKVSDKNEK